ncbi:MAG: TraB/GumN family protein [Bacteroidota bacterium]
MTCRNLVWISLLSVIALPFSTAVAQTAPELDLIDLQAEEVAVVPTNSLIWEVRTPGQDQVSYIYGILFKMPAAEFFLPTGIDRLIEQTDKLVMEVDPLAHNLDHIHRGTIPLDSTLEELLPKKTFQQLNRYVKDSLSELATYKMQTRYAPLLLARQFICDYCLGFGKDQTPISYETYLAKKIKKPLKLLHTGWARTAWLDSYNFAEQTEVLMTSVDDRAIQCEVYRAMMRAYRRQNLDQMWLLSKDAPDMGDNGSRFIEARNQSWVESLVWSLKVENLFIAVNAVQLPGEYGLLHLLRKAGFQVNPVYLPIPQGNDE